MKAQCPKNRSKRVSVEDCKLCRRPDVDAPASYATIYRAEQLALTGVACAFHGRESTRLSAQMHNTPGDGCEGKCSPSRVSRKLSAADSRSMKSQRAFAKENHPHMHPIGSVVSSANAHVCGRTNWELT